VVSKQVVAAGRVSGREQAHLARILWHMLKLKEAFNPVVFAKEEAKMRRKKLQRLESMATTLNYRIIPIQ
jgi:hypothetical protein